MTELPNGLELLKNLKELHIQSNRLQLMSPNLSNSISKNYFHKQFLNKDIFLIVKLDIFNTKAIFKLDNNPWIQQIIDSSKIGLNHLSDFLSSEEYQSYYISLKIFIKRFVLFNFVNFE